jgi:hypothetical protein
LLNNPQRNKKKEEEEEEEEARISLICILQSNNQNGSV